MSFVNYNGKLFKEGTPLVEADNRGLRYGDGLFETMKMKAGKLVFAAEHMERIWNGMKILEFVSPAHFTKDFLLGEISKLCSKNKAEHSARIRLNVIRGNGGLYDLKNHASNFIIQCWPLEEGYDKWNSNGLVTGIYTPVKKTCDILSNLKHNNYLPYVMAALQAKKEKWNDAIVLNTMGRICDTTIANIFIIKDEVIYTPALEEGCVAGVIRKMLIKTLTAQNRQVRETAITIEDILSADEVFFTNSMYNLRWVRQISDRQYTNNITREIYASFISTIY